MNDPIQLSEQYYVAPQLEVADLAVLKSQGFERVINNRPDGEAEDQPASQQLQAEADRLGLEYVANPVKLPELSQVQVECQSDALTESKKTLAFCRTGTRSTVLWVLMENQNGRDFEGLVAEAQGKSMELSRCQPAMQPLIRN